MIKETLRTLLKSMTVEDLFISLMTKYFKSHDYDKCNKIIDTIINEIGTEKLDSEKILAMSISEVLELADLAETQPVSKRGKFIKYKYVLMEKPLKCSEISVSKGNVYKGFGRNQMVDIQGTGIWSDDICVGKFGIIYELRNSDEGVQIIPRYQSFNPVACNPNQLLTIDFIRDNELRVLVEYRDYRIISNNTYDIDINVIIVNSICNDMNDNSYIIKDSVNGLTAVSICNPEKSYPLTRQFIHDTQLRLTIKN